MTRYERLEGKIDKLTVAFYDFQEKYYKWMGNDWVHHCEKDLKRIENNRKTKAIVAYLVVITSALLLIQLKLLEIL